MTFLKLVHGDALRALTAQEDESVDLVVTSPPYWGMRDYGVAGQLGNEPTMEEYLENTLAWVNQAWRILKPSGSLVLNIGDCYFGSWGGSYDRDGVGSQENQPYGALRKTPERSARFYKEKQFLSVSSFAYCKIVSETDFVCRTEEIWCKPNVMNSHRSRRKFSHEKVFWFVKDANENYWDEKPWLRDAIVRDRKKNVSGGIGAGGRRDNRRSINLTPHAGEASKRRAGATSASAVGNDRNAYLKKKIFRGDHSANADGHGSTSALRSGTERYENKWSETPQTIEHSWRVVAVGEGQDGFESFGKFKHAKIAYKRHFKREYERLAYELAGVERPLELLATSDVDADCDALPELTSEQKAEASRKASALALEKTELSFPDFVMNQHVAPFPEKLIHPWVESLTPMGGVVLDPFVGSGTSMKVARDLRRSCIGIDLNEKYLDYAKKRLNWGVSLADVQYEEKTLN